jgi:hypothetical protein
MPDVVSYVSSDVDSAHGTLETLVSVTTPRISVRTAVDAVLGKGRVTEAVTPLAAVYEVALPITVPDAFKNEMVPVQDAAVPLGEVVARLVTLIWAVSELANPTGGKLVVCVVVELDVVVWAIATDAVKPADAMSMVRNFGNNMLDPPVVFFDEKANDARYSRPLALSVLWRLVLPEGSACGELFTFLTFLTIRFSTQ